LEEVHAKNYKKIGKAEV